MSFIIALAGNPNVGKSTVFNALTGMNQHTGNWPGKTVMNAAGVCRHEGVRYELIDLPGVYSLAARSGEEEIARDFLLSGKANAVIVVCDATCLERNLILALQVLELTKNVVLCVNLLDEAQKKRINVNLSALENALGVPVAGASARDGKGLYELMQKAAAVCENKSPPAPHIQSEETHEARAKRLAAKAESIAGAAVSSPCRNCAGCGVCPANANDSRDRNLDRLFISGRTGIPVMLALLSLVLAITLYGANAPSNALAKALFFVQYRLGELFAAMGAADWLRGAVVEGAFRVLAWVVSVMLPPMAIFFPLFTLLEDFGYLPRVAFNLDYHFKKAKACGKQALTMCMGFGCNAVGVTGCRIIDSPRERLIAVLTNNLVPCNGRFPTLIAFASMFLIGSATGALASLLSTAILTAMITLAVGLTLLASRVLSGTVLKGEPSFFALELPPYRMPRFGRVITRSLLDRTIFVLGRAAAVAAPAGLLIWILANVTVANASLLAHCAAFLNPFASALGLDGVILLAFILGLPANEIVVPIMLMAYASLGTLPPMENFADMKALLVQNGWTWATAASAMLMCLMHWPCSTTLLTIKKETGSLKWTALAAAIPTAMGMLSCAAFTAIVRLLGLA